MLVLNVVFVISAIHFTVAVPIDPAVPSVKLKRVIVDTDHDIYNQEPFGGTQSTPRISLPRDTNSRPSPYYRSTKASDPRKVSYTSPSRGLHAYGSVPKRPFAHVSSSIHQTEPYQSSPLAPYFDVLSNPGTYKTGATGAEKPLDAGSKSIVSPSLQKLQGTYSPAYNALHRDKSIELSDFSDSEYPSYSSITKIISQSFPNGVSSSTVQVPVYKTNYSPSKVTDYAHVYAPSFPTSASTPFHSFDKAKQSPQQNNEATVDVNGKKISVPIIQLQSSQDLPGVFPFFESQPVILSASYPIASDLGFSFDDRPKFNNLAVQSKNVSPFLSPLSRFQGQIVPIQTASSTPQFPQYKGASVGVYPVSRGRNVPKAQGSYESFYSQPQLHFSKEHGGQSANVRQNAGHPSTSSDDILEDVEIINKKNPEPHPSKTDDDDDEEDERYKSPEKGYDHGSDEEDDIEPAMFFKEPLLESDFKPSMSFPFKEYDEKFGKHAMHIDSDDDSEDKPYSGYKNHPSSEIDDEEEEDSSEYHAENVETSKPSHGSYEEEDEEEEEESRKDERREETDGDSYEVEPKQSKYHGKDFEREFEESYRKELPKHRHVKEVPVVDGYDDSKLPKEHLKNDSRSRANREGKPEESKSQHPRVFRKNRKVPKTSDKDSAAYSSDFFAKKEPSVIYEEFFGYKNSETGKHAKHARAKAASEKHSPAKKPSKQSGYPRAAKYYKFKSPKSGDGLTSKNKHPYSHSSTSNWKLAKDSPAEAVSESSVRQLSGPSDVAISYAPISVSGPTRSLTNAEILRDLTGI